jgi:pyridoxine 5-phosphate synthase
MNVHAGHGLDFETAKLITKLPYLQEVNIGHSIICYSIEMGLKKAIQKMKFLL